MPQPNSMNTGKGKDFQKLAAKILSEMFRVSFETECVFQIGNPPKPHKFDLGSTNRQIVGECKNYSWTEGNNVPSAKMAFLNEAVFYLQHLPVNIRKLVVMRKDVNPKRQESLANYYYRTNRHLLNDVEILEIDTSLNSVRIISDHSR